MVVPLPVTVASTSTSAAAPVYVTLPTLTLPVPLVTLIADVDWSSVTLVTVVALFDASTVNVAAPVAETVVVVRFCVPPWIVTADALFAATASNKLAASPPDVIVSSSITRNCQVTSINCWVRSTCGGTNCYSLRG